MHITCVLNIFWNVLKIYRYECSFIQDVLTYATHEIIHDIILRTYVTPHRCSFHSLINCILAFTFHMQSLWIFGNFITVTRRERWVWTSLFRSRADSQARERLRSGETFIFTNYTTEINCGGRKGMRELAKEVSTKNGNKPTKCIFD